ncbi:MAG: SRPBCC family protein [Chloroflexia bacterium]
MAHFEKSLEIAAPVEKVWQYIVQGTSALEYMPMVIGFEFTRPVEYRPGDRFRITLRILGVPIEFESEVQEEIPNRKLTFSSISGMKNSTTYLLEPSPLGCRVTFVSDYELPGGLLGQIADRLAVQRAMEQGVSEGLERLKQKMEEG